MRVLDLTYPSAAENLACDEAMLDQCEEGLDGEVLRFWESLGHFVVLGMSGELRKEVREENCAARGMPVLRRVSGGGTVVQGPGVLNYAVVIRPDASHDASSVRGAHRYVLGKLAGAIASLTGELVQQSGDSDLTIAGRKISGNAQRRRGRAVLVHGTLLVGLDVSIVEDVLPLPDRMPHYRGERGHTAFLRNLTIDRTALKERVCEAWNARECAVPPGEARIRQLVEQRYGAASWIRRR